MVRDLKTDLTGLVITDSYPKEQLHTIYSDFSSPLLVFSKKEKYDIMDD
jgi:hypothetical protein